MKHGKTTFKNKKDRAPVQAVAYLRTSSAANVGADKDSDRRQRDAITSFAERSGFVIVEEFYDAAVSGADPIDVRPGFLALLERIASNGVRTVLVEDASRFARTLMTQEAGIATLAGLGVRVLTTRGDDLTESDDEMRVAMRQIAGVFSQLEKTRLVKKLAAARARKRAAGHKVEGRKGHAELRPDAVRMAKRLHAKPRKGARLTLRAIAKRLADAGFRNNNGGEFNPASIKAMLDGPMPTD